MSPSWATSPSGAGHFQQRRAYFNKSAFFNKAAPLRVGDVWTWVGIDRETKLVISWYTSPSRDTYYASEFMADLRERIVGRPQVTTDGHGAYLEAVERAFGADVDYAQ